MQTVPAHTEIAIIGAGPVGVLAALMLHRLGRQVVLLEARPAQASIRDKRTLALSFNTLNAFAEAGIMLPSAQTSAITHVHISQQGKLGRTLLRAEDLQQPLLGRSADYALIIKACEEALLRERVPVLWETKVESVQTASHFAQIGLQHANKHHTLTADWIIMAEGGALAESLPGIHRESFDYRQSALVATLHFDTPPGGTAYERFADCGPFALLPYGEAFRLVWTRTPEDAQALQTMSTAAFAKAFAEAFGNRLGTLHTISDSAVFPLQLKQLNRVYSGRVICIGNAAQTMHPVAAQGLNLGIRDAQVLVAHFAQPYSMNNHQLAAQYAAARRLDAHAIVGFTHSLVTLFDQPNSILKLGRGSVMALLDSVPALRKKFTEHLIFGL